ncbi:plant lipid transfer protein/Par allergen [Artemisia annua]|uniref:Plant lipid transfer protein/Par allergen n=1 Tax=Artemisia annua TaxID=35608 RepID=A0A2U1PJN9_ARTAN|nr:plant lipid transfer protein/Par allergen [Artemisia annua]
MAPKVQEIMSVVLVVMIMICGGANAQSSSCTSTLMGLQPCLNFVTGNTTTPSPSCCSQLANVVQTQPRCLCSLLNGNVPNIGLSINQTLALTLPGACQVQTPPISQCNASGPTSGPASAPTSPASAPTGSTDESQTQPSEETPEAQAPATPSTPSVPSGSGSGSKSTPSANSASGSKFGAATYLMFFVLFIGTKL